MYLSFLQVFFVSFDMDPAPCTKSYLYPNHNLALTYYILLTYFHANILLFWILWLILSKIAK